jgi:hypothetical protein
MLPTMLGCVVQWKLPVATALAVLEAPGARFPKSTELSSITMRWATVSLFRNITCSPLAFGTGFGWYEALPLVPTIEMVIALGVLDPGPVGVSVEPPPLHRDAETAAASTVVRINTERMLFLQEMGGCFVEEQAPYQREFLRNPSLACPRVTSGVRGFGDWEP